MAVYQAACSVPNIGSLSEMQNKASSPCPPTTVRVAEFRIAAQTLTTTPRERVAALSGTLEFGAQGGGWRVGCVYHWYYSEHIAVDRTRTRPPAGRRT